MHENYIKISSQSFTIPCVGEIAIVIRYFWYKKNCGVYNAIINKKTNKNMPLINIINYSYCLLKKNLHLILYNMFV